MLAEQFICWGFLWITRVNVSRQPLEPSCPLCGRCLPWMTLLPLGAATTVTPVWIAPLTVRACRCPCEKLKSGTAAGNTIITNCPPTSSLCRWKLKHASPELHEQSCSDSTSSSHLGRELRFHTECLRFWSCCYASETCVLVHLDLAGNTQILCLPIAPFKCPSQAYCVMVLRRIRSAACRRCHFCKRPASPCWPTTQILVISTCLVVCRSCYELVGLRTLLQKMKFFSHWARLNRYASWIGL